MRNALLDLRNYLRTNFDADNLTNYATRPIVIIGGEHETSDGSGAVATGIIKLLRSSKRDEYVNHVRKNTYYTVPATISMDAQSDTTDINEVMDEIDRLIDLNSISGYDAAEILNMDYDGNINVPVINLTFELSEYLVTVTLG